jgi:hypothetical protein
MILPWFLLFHGMALLACLMLCMPTSRGPIPLQPSSPGASPDEAAISVFGASSDVEHESQGRKCRARRKRATDNAHNLRRSTRLMAKEEPSYEPPATKASRVQQAKFDYSGASRRLRTAISRSHLLSGSDSLLCDHDALVEIAAACGATQEDLSTFSGETAGPSGEA